jgi:hypothetical protein
LTFSKQRNGGTILLDNRKLTLIKYQGTLNFIAGLFIEETAKEYFFGFMPTETPTIITNNNGDYAINELGAKILFVDKYQTIFEVKGKTFGKSEKLFSLIRIKPEEFDSMYKLLECVWE